MNENYNQFFTATILEWKPLLKQDKYKQVIMDSLSFLVRKERIKLFGFVVMPNHIHLIWRVHDLLKPQDVQRDFLKYTAMEIKRDLRVNHPAVLERFRVDARDRQYQIWERNPLSVNLYSREVLIQKLDYIHNNPMQHKWQLCSMPETYKFSSAQFYIDNTSEWDFLSHYNE